VLHHRARLGLPARIGRLSRELRVRDAQVRLLDRRLPARPAAEPEGEQSGRDARLLEGGRRDVARPLGAAEQPVRAPRPIEGADLAEQVCEPIGR